MKQMVFLILIFSASANAADFCQRQAPDILQLAENKSSRISFKNSGGLFNGGVCWWHSRLQRASIYLARYAPEKELPSKGELKKILKHLKNMDSVVEIPGFSDFGSFTRKYENEVQSMLNQWQKEDGFINQQWIQGLSGRSRLPASKLRQKMDQIFISYKKSPTLVWLMAQIKGVTSHALLLVEMRESAHGYDLGVIDSNSPLKTKYIGYNHGDEFLKFDSSSYQFVPYTGFQQDFVKIFTSLNNHCENRSSLFPTYDFQSGDIELSDGHLHEAY